MYDAIIAGGKVIDGSGSPAFDADIALERGTIAAIGDLKGAAARQRIDAGDKPHPRQDATFPKVLGELVRERKAMTLEQAVHKMSGYTAQAFGLEGIGLVKQGYRADITVFDPATIRANATFKDPRRFPDGIDWVFVGGKAVVVAGESTGELNGRVLRKGAVHA